MSIAQQQQQKPPHAMYTQTLLNAHMQAAQEGAATQNIPGMPSANNQRGVATASGQ